VDQAYKEYIRIVNKIDGNYLEVCCIAWQGPHTPVSKWKTVRALKDPMTLEQLESEVARLLNGKRYFGFCTVCKSHHPKGHMYGDSYCQSCASDELGVVY